MERNEAIMGLAQMHRAMEDFPATRRRPCSGRSAIWSGRRVVGDRLGGLHRLAGRSTTGLAPWLNAEKGSRMSEHVVVCALVLSGNQPGPSFCHSLGSARSWDAESRERFADGRMPHVFLNRARPVMPRPQAELGPRIGVRSPLEEQFRLFAETMRGF
jgi:hypothetical protein